jgi:PucR C-terminal helix-turn-helix domain/GGDEF-like domain
MDPISGEIVAAVRDAVDPLTDEVVQTIRNENRTYSDVLGGPEGIGIRLGIEQAIKSFLDAVERGERPGAETAEVWRRLGEAEFQAGRTLEALRAAWRSGTRAAWRGAADVAAQAGVPTESVIQLAEAIFVFTDELATDVVEGYLRMQSDEAGELERRRRRLAALLLDAENHDPEAIEHAAELARWQLPRSVAVLALQNEVPGALRRRLGPDVLAGGDAEGGWIVLADPEAPGRAKALARALRGISAALGPTVAPSDAHRSLRWARLTLSLSASGALPAERPTRTENHLATVLVLQDRELAGELVHSRLGPLYELADPERERLLQTLAAWLEHQRHTPQIARQLHVHPQTVRYRIGKLRELLGDALEDPDARFELEVALRARRALAG